MPRHKTSARSRFGTARRLPSGRWQVRYHDPDGIRRAAPAPFDTEREALDWLRDVEATVRLGQWQAPDRGDVLLGDYAALWLDGRVDLRPKTVEDYRARTRRWLGRRLDGRVELGDLPLSKLTPTRVRDWYAAAVRQAHADAVERAEANAGRARSRAHPARLWAAAQGLDVAPSGRLPREVLNAWQRAGSPVLAPVAEPVTVPDDAGRAEVAAAYRMLRAILSTAVTDGLIDVNPCRVTRGDRADAPEREPATPAQVMAAADAAPGRFRAAVLLAAYGGLRAGELFALARRHVDTDLGLVRVERTLVELASQPVTFGPPKTSSSTRTVAIGPTLAGVLAAHLDQWVDADPDALVFTSSTGRPVTRSHRADWWDRARTAAGLPDGFRWHDLRHTGATLALTDGGATVRDLQARHGWSSPRMALHYAHATDERARIVADRLDAVLDGTVVPLAAPAVLQPVAEVDTRPVWYATPGGVWHAAGDGRANCGRRLVGDVRRYVGDRPAGRVCRACQQRRADAAS